MLDSDFLPCMLVSYPRNGTANRGAGIGKSREQESLYFDMSENRRCVHWLKGWQVFASDEQSVS